MEESDFLSHRWLLHNLQDGRYEEKAAWKKFYLSEIIHNSGKYFLRIFSRLKLKLLTLNNILPPACFPWELTSAWFSWLAGCTSATRATIGEIHGAPVVCKYKYKVEHKFKICCCYGEENRVVLAVLRRLLCCEITAGASCQGNINALPRKSTLPQFHLLAVNKDKGLLPKFILSEHIKKPKEIPAFNWEKIETKLFFLIKQDLVRDCTVNIQWTLNNI